MTFTTKRIIDFFWQLPDLMIFKVIYYNRNMDFTSCLERDLMVLETCLEAAPQMIINLAIIIKGLIDTNSNPSTIIVISVITSLFQLIATIQVHDKHRCINGDKCCRKCCFWTGMLFWRILEMTSRIIILTLLWVILGFIPFIIIFGIDVIIVLILFFKRKKLNALTSLIYIEQFGFEIARIFWFRWWQNIIHLILITFGTIFYEINIDGDNNYIPTFKQIYDGEYTELHEYAFDELYPNFKINRANDTALDLLTS